MTGPTYIAEGGIVHRVHPCGFRQPLRHDAAKGLLAAHGRLSRPTDTAAMQALRASLTVALAEAALQRADAIQPTSTERECA